MVLKVDFEETDVEMDLDIDEVIVVNESGGTSEPATETTLGGIKVGQNLKITEDGTLSVDTADIVEKDNTKPVTSAAVAVQVGNIEVLLETI